MPLGVVSHDGCCWPSTEARDKEKLTDAPHLRGARRGVASFRPLGGALAYGQLAMVHVVRINKL